MAQITNLDRETFLIHALELKLWLFEVCVGSHSLAMFAKKILRAREINVTGAQGTLTTLYRTLCILLFGCLLALYGSTMHPARLCDDFQTIFFRLRCGPLEKKKETRIFLYIYFVLEVCCRAARACTVDSLEQLEYAQ